MSERRRYRFDRPDPDAAARARADLDRLALGGNYSADTYKDRARARRGDVTTPAEREASRAYNRAWKRRKRKGFPCIGPDCTGTALFATPGTLCYWCRPTPDDALPF